MTMDSKADKDFTLKPLLQSLLMTRQRRILRATLPLVLMSTVAASTTVAHASGSELDSDADGIPDAVEIANAASGGDSDGDGIPDHLDDDSDHDGIPDSLEGVTDTDGDGTPNYIDPDSDGDSIPDSVEAGFSGSSFTDTDADGMPDMLDTDSDGDGTPDSVEAGIDPSHPADSDGNGVPDFQQPDEGSLPPVDSDIDGDGISDAVENANARNGGDTDADGVPDRQDLDSDNDGLADSLEAGFGDTPLDSDGDGVFDYLDLDSDNDGLTDAFETHGLDSDGTGQVDGFFDANNDGFDDQQALNPLAPVDTDGDGVADFLDLDSDNDGLSDVFESSGIALDANGDGRIDDLTDNNNDGLVDVVIPNSVLDTDGDGVANHRDLDSDGDGVFDLAEVGGDDQDNDGRVDFAGDTPANGFQPFTVGGETGNTTNLPDANGNSVPDVLEFDDGANEPTEGPIEGPTDESDPPVVRTGLDGIGIGCSVAGSFDSKDPILPGLALMAGLLLILRSGVRSGLRRVSGEAQRED